MLVLVPRRFIAMLLAFVQLRIRAAFAVVVQLRLVGNAVAVQLWLSVLLLLESYHPYLPLFLLLSCSGNSAYSFMCGIIAIEPMTARLSNRCTYHYMQGVRDAESVT